MAMSETVSSVAFSSDGVEVISRQVEADLTLEEARRTTEQVESFYELQRCATFITDNGYHRIALQFPDSMLCDAAQVALRLREATKGEMFIMADTSYGSCCVDEVAAEHVAADCVIHYGPSCLTQTKRLPVLCVFGQRSIDLRHCVQEFKQLFTEGTERVLVLYDTSYSHCVDALRDALTSDYPHCVFSTLVLPTPLSSGHTHSNISMVTSTTCSCDCAQGACRSEQATTSSIGNKERVEDTSSRTTSEPHPSNDVISDHTHNSYKVFYIGSEGQTLNNLILNYSQCQFSSYDPVTKRSRIETMNVNKALGRRYYLMQRAKAAKTVGILVGTLGAANYLDSIQRLKDLLKQAGKKYYTIAVGKLNVPKMANFLEIDVFVLVACPENSLLESQEFYKPVVTPYEMEVACNRCREWSGDYTTDFRELLPGAVFHVSVDEGANDQLEPEYSLISGGLLPSRQQDDQGASSSALVQRSKMEVAIQKSAGASFLHSRSWRGLEQQLGQSEVTMATEGISGIASGYTHEPSAEKPN